MKSSCRSRGELKVQGSCHSTEFHIYRYFTLQSFSCQCKEGYAGDGEECEIDPDLDGIPSVGLSCTLPNCFKVRNIFYAKECCLCLINVLTFTVSILIGAITN